MSKTYGISTLAALRRHMYPGQKWHLFNHLRNEDMGVRKVNRVTPSKISFDTDKGTAFLDMPKSENYKPHEDEQGFDVMIGGAKALTYREVE